MKTKSFRVAVEGDTVDGRTIERQWLTDIASTYNPATYGARVNKEHIRGLSGTEPFKALGDVLSCSTEEIELEIGGKKQKRLALNAEIDATDDLVALAKDGQKVYTSWSYDAAARKFRRKPAEALPKLRTPERPISASAVISPELAVPGPINTASGAPAWVKPNAGGVAGSGWTGTGKIPLGVRCHGCRTSPLEKKPNGDAPSSGSSPASIGHILPPPLPRRSTIQPHKGAWSSC